MKFDRLNNLFHLKKYPITPMQFIGQIFIFFLSPVHLSYIFQTFRNYTESAQIVISEEDKVADIERYKLRTELLNACEQYIFQLHAIIADNPNKNNIVVIPYYYDQIMSALYVMSHRLGNRSISHWDYTIINQFYHSLKQNNVPTNLIFLPNIMILCIPPT